MRKPLANLDTFAGRHHASPGRLGQPGVTKKADTQKALIRTTKALGKSFSYA